MVVEGLPGTAERTLRTCVGHRRLGAVGRPLYDPAASPQSSAVQSVRVPPVQ